MPNWLTKGFTGMPYFQIAGKPVLSSAALTAIVLDSGVLGGEKYLCRINKSIYINTHSWKNTYTPKGLQLWGRLS